MITPDQLGIEAVAGEQRFTPAERVGFRLGFLYVTRMLLKLQE